MFSKTLEFLSTSRQTDCLSWGCGYWQCQVPTYLMCSRCSGMGPSLSLLHSSLLLQAVDAAHKLKPKDKENILVRTGSSIPGKYQYYRGPVWLQSGLHSCFPQDFVTSSTPVTQTSLFLGATYVLSLFLQSSSFLDHLPDIPRLGSNLPKFWARWSKQEVSSIP